jgi:hypothetical protein
MAKIRKPVRKYYIGIDSDGNWFGFGSIETPTRENCPQWVATIGAFRTRRGQLWALQYGKYNPHFTHVNDAERYAKIEADKGK